MSRARRRGSKDLAGEEEEEPPLASASASQAANQDPWQPPEQPQTLPPADVVANVSGPSRALEPLDRPHSPATEVFDDEEPDGINSSFMQILDKEPERQNGSKESITSSEARWQASQRASDIVVPGSRVGTKDSATSSELRLQAQTGNTTAIVNRPGIPRQITPNKGVYFSGELEDDENSEEGSDDDDEEWTDDEEQDFNAQDSMFAWQLEDQGFLEGKDALEAHRMKGPSAEQVKDWSEGLVHVNSTGMLGFLCFAVMWVFSAAALMLALTWHYVWVEVTSQADLAARSAVEHGSLHTSEVLSPATTVMKTLDIGFRGGVIGSINDYAGYKKVLEPFFQALPDLRSVEMADTPEYLQYVSPGSVLATRNAMAGGGIELLSDRGDCARVPGGRGCTLQPQRANGSSWFEERKPFYPHPWNPLPMFLAWDGPSFARDLPHEAICDELCWSPTYSLASRISAGTDPYFATNNRSFDPYLSAIVRVTMEATVLIDVIKQVQMRCRGEAFICTDQGVLVAAMEMADAQTADIETGVVKMVKAWEFPRDWKSTVDDRLIFKGDGKSRTTGDGKYLVSAWRIDSPHNATTTLGDSLRIVLAIPSDAYADSVLQSLRYWFIAVSASPVAFILLASVFNIYLRYIRKGSRNFKDMSIEELQAITRKKKEAIRVHREKQKEERRKRRESHEFGGMKRQTTLNRMGSALMARRSFSGLSIPWYSSGSNSSKIFKSPFRKSESQKALADVRVDAITDGATNEDVEVYQGQ